MRMLNAGGDECKTNKVWKGENNVCFRRVYDVCIISHFTTPEADVTFLLCDDYYDEVENGSKTKIFLNSFSLKRY